MHILILVVWPLIIADGVGQRGAQDRELDVGHGDHRPHQRPCASPCRRRCARAHGRHHCRYQEPRFRNVWAHYHAGADSSSDADAQDSNQFHAVCLDTYPPITYLNDTSRAIIDLCTRYNSHAGEIKVLPSPSYVVSLFHTLPPPPMFTPGCVHV